MNPYIYRIGLVLSLGFSSLAAQAGASPKNVVFLIGDGMGPAYTTAYRYFSAGDPATPPQPTVFDSLLVGMATTFPDDDTWVTDSAAAATALATGHKTYNGAIGIDRNEVPLTSLIAEARHRGMLTGVIATSQINHATPASFLAHDRHRKNYNAIADDYLGSDGHSPVADLLLGGGTSYFIRPDVNLINRFQERGYQYLNRLESLDKLTLPAIGLFAPQGLPPALGSAQPNRLSIMTKAALTRMEATDRPFVLVVEASQIDWCAHANDIACAMSEMEDFARTLTLVKEFIDRRGDTLMVATADHSTGGLTLGRAGIYQWRADLLRKVNMLPDDIARLLLASPAELDNILQTQTGLQLSEQQRTLFEQALSDDQDSSQEQLAALVKNLIDEATYTGWTTSGHDAIDVQVFAHGPGAALFQGMQDNTAIGQKLKALLPGRHIVAGASPAPGSSR
ncbi:alkaline phosphatase [Shewanella sp. GXUN23E]|uniref:alkaline phosphatase n=1 Tax=Shewanella sp. GXUN23E TaxID=3422498 RepID=UPI003D7D1763